MSNKLTLAGTAATFGRLEIANGEATKWRVVRNFRPNFYYANGNNSLFYFGKPIAELPNGSSVFSDSKTEYLNANGNVYYRGEGVLKDTRPATFFEKITGLYYKDNYRVYFFQQDGTLKVMNEVDYTSAKSLSSFDSCETHADEFSILMDKEHVYINGKVLEDADPHSLDLLQYNNECTTYLADKRHVYIDGRKAENISSKSVGFDETFPCDAYSYHPGVRRFIPSALARGYVPLECTKGMIFVSPFDYFLPLPLEE